MNSDDFAQIKGIAFDLDGTLVDSAPGLAAAVDLMLQALGYQVAGRDRVCQWIGNGADILVKRALAWAGCLDDDLVLERARTLFDHFYGQQIELGTQLYPHVLSVLNRLAQQGYQMALVTNKPTPFVAPLLKQLEIDGYFKYIIGGDDVVVKKPHPAPIYLVLAKLGLYADQLVFVGDSRNDIEAGKAAGSRTIGLTYGYNYGQPIADSQPDWVIDHFSQLLSILGSSPLESNRNVI